MASNGEERSLSDDQLMARLRKEASPDPRSTIASWTSQLRGGRDHSGGGGLSRSRGSLWGSGRTPPRSRPATKAEYRARQLGLGVGPSGSPIEPGLRRPTFFATRTRSRVEGVLIASPRRAGEIHLRDQLPAEHPADRFIHQLAGPGRLPTGGKSSTLLA